MFPKNASRENGKPMLILTGTRDNSMRDYKSRTLPYDDMPAGCKWLGVIDGATHMNFAGVEVRRSHRETHAARDEGIP